MSASINADDLVIISAQRTALGKFNGQFKQINAPLLGAAAIRGALTNLPPHLPLDEVFMGQVLSASCGQAPARQAALLADLPASVPCTGVTKVCGSGMQAVIQACDRIRAGHAASCIAGGMENMSRAPHLLSSHRSGTRLGSSELLDHMYVDGLQDAYNGLLMGQIADIRAQSDKIERKQMDLYAQESVLRAHRAIASGAFSAEICAVETGTSQICTDEIPGSLNIEKIPSLRPAFGAEGRITAANAASISDGAAALLVCSARFARQHQLVPLAVIRGYTQHAATPDFFVHAPVHAIQKLLHQLNWTPKEVDLFEINEAFASVVLYAMQQLQIDAARVNCHGGACALGHPIGASGARIIVTLLHALRAQQLRRGIASLCIGGGEALALALEIPD